VSVSLLVAAIVVWFGAGAALSFYARTKTGSGMSEFFLANRGIGGVVSALTYSATTYSAFMMVGLVGITYRSGVASLGFELAYLAATVVLLTVFAPRYWVAGRRFNLVTPPELLSLRYGSRTVGCIAAVLSLVMLVPYASVQLMGVGYLVETLSGGGIPFAAGILLAAGISLIYSRWAGLRSVAWTDALQAGIMMIACVVLAWYVPSHLLPSGVGDAVRTVAPLLEVSWPWPMFLGMTLPWAFFAVTNPQVVQRLYSPRDVTSIKRMIAGFAGFGLVYTVLCVVLGLAAAVVVPGLANPDGAMAALLARVPCALSLVVFLSIVAAAVSTLTAVMLTLSSIVARDIARTLNPGIGEETELAAGKAAIPVIAAVCCVFASLRPGLIVVLSSLASGGLLAQVPAVFGAFFWRRGTSQGAILSMIAGALTMIVLSAWKVNFLGQWPSVWTLAVSTASYVLASLLSPREKCADAFVDAVEGERRKRFPDA
jgi:SSS family solute:Na+ symporter